MTTDLAGVTMSSDAHDIWVNWQGLMPNSDSFVDISTSNSQTPEPATMVLFGTGLIDLAGLARRKKNS